MTAIGVVLGLLSAVVFGVAAVVQAQAVRGFESSPDGLWGFVARSVRDGRTMAVVAAYLVGFVLHAAAIWLLPLYLAQALVAMSLPVTAVASHRVEDRLRRTGWAAVGVVTLALCCSRWGRVSRARCRRPRRSWWRSGSAWRRSPSPRRPAGTRPGRCSACWPGWGTPA